MEIEVDITDIDRMIMCDNCGLCYYKEILLRNEKCVHAENIFKPSEVECFGCKEKIIISHSIS